MRIDGYTSPNQHSQEIVELIIEPNSSEIILFKEDVRKDLA